MSLTNVAQQTKAMIVVSGIMIVVIVVGSLSWNIGKQFYRNLNPTPPPQPTYGFGRLPQIEFPKKDTSNLTIRTEAIPSNIKSFKGYFINVYLITNLKKSSGFFSLDRAKKQAASLGFVLEPQLLSGTEYRWTKTNPLPATLDMDTVNNRFVMDVDWETDPKFLNATARPSADQAISEIKSLLRNADFLAKDLENGRSVGTLLEFTGTRFNEAISLSETEFVQVDLFREPLRVLDDTFEVVPPDPNKGIAQGLVSSNRAQGKRIVSLEYSYITIDYDTPQTYPYIKPEQALQLLQNGQGFIAVEPKLGNEAVIRQIDVGYYDPLSEEQKYLQPIYIFRGDNDFVAYVPAIAPQALEGGTTETSQ